MKKITTGILAHVDAGKTTLSEALLYSCKSIRTLGRVDYKNAFLDTDEQERARGITIFSKNAIFEYKDMSVTLLDTPGHVDFSAEMERTLQVLDYAVLVVSANDGIQGHTQTLWKLLKKYSIPTFIFVNKMDQSGADKEAIMQEITKRLSDSCAQISGYEDDENIMEEIALKDESLLEKFLQGDYINDTDICGLISENKLVPVYFGSALKLEGIEQFIEAFYQYTQVKNYSEDFAARVYKISRDEQGNRLTHLKVTGGTLKVKDVIKYNENEEKINQIRVYSGAKYTTCQEIKAGEICAVTGLTKVLAGEGLGAEKEYVKPYIQPVLTYRLVLNDGTDPAKILPKLKMLEEEEPQLHVTWNEELAQIQVQLMGEVQIDILKNIIEKRFDFNVGFDTGNIIYRETISNKVEGIGHFEPLRHYAHVHIMMEPLPAGSGIVIETACREDILDKNWQRLIITHLHEKRHRGVLTGAFITDIKITLISGKSHTKHTEGGDFRQASYRAVRQGLMEADSVLLEPYYDFELRIPSSCVGRAMTDLENMHSTFSVEENDGENAMLTGHAPVVCIMGYQTQVVSYTKGMGNLFMTFRGYEPCHNADEVIMAKRYNPTADLENTPDSVFCEHGAGIIVPWNQVKSYVNIYEKDLYDDGTRQNESSINATRNNQVEKYTGSYKQDKELEDIFLRTFGKKNDTKKDIFRKKSDNVYDGGTKKKSAPKKKGNYLLVDGYNILFAWQELNELSKINIDGARNKLQDILCNYQGYTKCNLILVFDAYKVAGHKCEMIQYNNISVVYTAHAQTADSYIEQFAHEMAKDYNITVATSDRLEQMIIMGEGCTRLSANDFKMEIDRVNEQIKETYTNRSSSVQGNMFNLGEFFEGM